jgi:hypothetical protein
MKIKIGDKIYNANNELVMIIFDNDTEREKFIKISQVGF